MPKREIKLSMKPEILKQYAAMIKHECLKHQNCQDCPMFDRYKPGYLHSKTCPFFNSENPEDWLVN